MNAQEFCKHINDSVESLADFTGVGRKNLEKYYTLTDFCRKEIKSLSGVPQAFAQFTLHAQNGYMISGIVNFFKNYSFLKERLLNFEPVDFLDKYGFSSEADRDDVVNRIVEALRFNENTNPNGLKWTTNKSNKKDAMMIRFANSLIDGALFFKQFNSRAEIIADLTSHYPNNDFRTLVEYLKSNFKHGFSVALCCDFLKEFDKCFDLPKPDFHLMEVMAKYKGYRLNYYKSSDKKAFECIDDFLEVVKEIKKIDSSMTAYKLDRQIWLCCSGNFYLDKQKTAKQLFLSRIA